MVKAGIVAFGGTISILIGPFIPIEGLYVAAIHTKAIDQFRHGLVG